MGNEVEITADGLIAGTLLRKGSLERRIDMAGIGLPDSTWTEADYAVWEVAFDTEAAFPINVYIRRGMEKGLDFDACNDAYYIGRMLREHGKFDPVRDAMYWYRDIGNLTGSVGYLWLRDGRMHRIWGVGRS